MSNEDLLSRVRELEKEIAVEKAQREHLEARVGRFETGFGRFFWILGGAFLTGFATWVMGGGFADLSK